MKGIRTTLTNSSTKINVGGRDSKYLVYSLDYTTY